jgi:hypothetical protein
MHRRFTRRSLERAHTRACLTCVLVVMLPLLVLLVSGALANGRLWMQHMREYNLHNNDI